MGGKIKFTKLTTLAILTMILSIPVLASVKIDVPGPAGSVDFGGQLYVLANGNVVVADVEFSPSGSPQNIGAVYLINGATGEIISTLTGSSADDEVGDLIRVLPNGNFVVGSRNWDIGGIADVGAVTLCNGTTGCSGTVSAANSLIGSTANDSVGDVVDVLPTGNYVVRSVGWDNGASFDAGAATFCTATAGCTGPVSSSNSLVGTKTQDHVGEFNSVVTTGDYVVLSAAWQNSSDIRVGAATHCSGMTGCAGTISSANSLVGSQAGDGNSLNMIPLSNDKYAVIWRSWDNGGTSDAGAVTFCSAPTGCTGEVSTLNSLYGISENDRVGSSNRILELPNGKIVISNTVVNINGVSGAGAVTFCDSAVTCNGPVSETNSLYGTTTNDSVGSFGILALANGNYVVQSAAWDLPGGINEAGAVTFCSGTAGCTGPVTTSNSLTGQTSSDLVGWQGYGLSNGNYVIVNSHWEGTTGGLQRGAVTFCDGTTGCTGAVSAANSLVGTTNGDRLGENQNGVLANGGFVVRSPDWGLTDVGAITYCHPTKGCPIGPVSAANSLVGTTADDSIGGNTVMPLSNGDYVVLSPDWDLPAALNGPNAGSTTPNAGAATHCSGETGCIGTVSDLNSLVGGSANDQIGRRGRALDMNYIVGSELFDDGGLNNVGAMAWCKTSNPCVGSVSAANAMIGTSSDDNIGDEVNLALPNGHYLFHSSAYAVPTSLAGEKTGTKSNLGGTPSRNGAVTIGNGSTGTFGSITEENSVIGTSSTGGSSMEFAYDPVFDQVVVGRPADSIVTLFQRTFPQAAPFDFDGDGRTDISIFRPGTGTWWINQSTDGLFAVPFGLAGDTLTPADYDGDGKSDISVWRPGAAGAAAIYILNSSDFSVTAKLFGQTGDDPYVVGDWDGDGKADPAVYRDSAAGSQSRFYYIGSDNNPGNGITFLNWGTTGDKPLRGDFDGDGKRDLAVFRPSNQVWYINQSSDASVRYESFGFATDIRLDGDFDGDGKTDLAVYRESELNWYYQKSSNLDLVKFPFGLAGDQLAPGDYDGDGKTDVAVFRNGQWIINNSGSGVDQYTNFGITGDISVPSRAVGN